MEAAKGRCNVGIDARQIAPDKARLGDWTTKSGYLDDEPTMGLGKHELECST